MDMGVFMNYQKLLVNFLQSPPGSGDPHGNACKTHQS